jgi:phage-related protein
MADKPLFWIGSSLGAVRAFPADARRAAGYQLRRVQSGLAPTDQKPLPTVGAGVLEIRIYTRTEHRIVYLAKFEEAVYVLHAFEKRSRKTNQADLALTRERLAQVRALRRKSKER